MVFPISSAYYYVPLPRAHNTPANDRNPRSGLLQKSKPEKHVKGTPQSCSETRRKRNYTRAPAKQYGFSSQHVLFSLVLFFSIAAHCYLRRYSARESLFLRQNCFFFILLIIFFFLSNNTTTVCVRARTHLPTRTEISVSKNENVNTRLDSGYRNREFLRYFRVFVRKQELKKK